MSVDIHTNPPLATVCYQCMWQKIRLYKNRSSNSNVQMQFKGRVSRIYTRVCIWIGTFAYSCMFLCIYVYSYAYTYLYLYVCTCVWYMTVCMYICMSVCIYLTTIIYPLVYSWPFITCTVILKEANSSSYPLQICARAHPCSVSRDRRIERSLGVGALQRFPFWTRQRGERFLSGGVFSRPFRDPTRFEGFVVLRMG